MRDRLLPTAALLMVAAAALALRLPSIAEPLGIDQSLWASAVRGMSRHQRLYRDVWEQRPPGIYFTYLAAFNIFGWTPAAVAWLDIAASAATTALLFGILRQLSTATTAAFAAALYATLTMPGWLYRHDGFLERSVCETFIVVCVAVAAWCAARWRAAPAASVDHPQTSATRYRSSDLWAFAVGFFGGAAVVFKPNAGLYLPAILLWMWCYRPTSITARDGARAFVIAVVGAAVAPVLTVFWLWRLDLLQDARVAVLDFNRFYVSQGLTFKGYAIDFSKAVWLRMKTDPIWLAGGIGSLVAVWELARRRSIDALAGLALLWGGAAALVIIVNGARLFNSYFIQAFAPLVVLATWLLARRSRGSISARVVSIATAALMLTLLVQRHYIARVYEWAEADIAVLRGTLDRSAYLERFGGYANNRGYSARANEELASYIREHTAPDERVFLFGINGAGVYFLSDRLTAQRFLRVNFFVPAEFPNPDFTLDAVVSELSTQRPRYVIFEELHSSSDMGKTVDSLPARGEIRRLLEPYRLDARIEDFALYRRRESVVSEQR